MTLILAHLEKERREIMRKMDRISWENIVLEVEQKEDVNYDITTWLSTNLNSYDILDTF